MDKGLERKGGRKERENEGRKAGRENGQIWLPYAILLVVTIQYIDDWKLYQ